MKTILFVSGTRADYGKIRPLIDALGTTHEFRVHVAVTGMHMLEEYGLTRLEVERNTNCSVDSFNNFDPESLVKSFQITLGGIDGITKKVRPDLMIIHGDRMEALAGACVGMMNQILIAHIEGGEISGTLDETMRHSITKMANIHFVANEIAAKRVLQLGENPETIFNIGSPEADLILSNELPNIHEVIKYYEIPFSNFGIVIFHPASKSAEEVRDNAQILVTAIEKSSCNFLIVLPNNDLHSDIIRDSYQPLRDLERVKFIPSMRFEFYLSALKHADFIMGNSSSGVREAPLVGTPSLDLGERQLNRSSAKSITHSEFGIENIRNFIRTAHRSEATSEKHFGDGKASKRFLEILQGHDFWTLPTSKQFNDLGK